MGQSGQVMVAIRQARRDEAEALAELEHAAYGHYRQRLGTQLPPMTVNFGELASAGQVWVAELDAAVVGFAVLYERPGHVLLDNLAVSPRARGRRIGARLVEFTEQHARERGCDQVRLYTNEAMTENIGYYTRRGYRETHRATEEGYHRVFFRKDLSGASDASECG